ncbi:MAG: HAMP domain-containing histidine kinase [Dermatophilaceae bacterium]|nr:HAMP domain-containing histidine kinase [Dermatophilaceae bacterium]
MRDWLAGRTLRTRLIAGVFVLLAVSCTIIGFATSITLQGFLFGRLDEQLVQAGSRLDVSRERPDRPGDSDRPSAPGRDPDVQGQTVGTLAVRVSDRSIEQAVVVRDTAGQISLSKVALTPADRSTLLNLTPGQPTTVRLSSLGEYRLRATGGPGGDTQVTGLSLQEIESTVHRLEVTELIVFAVALLLTGLAGAGWVTLSLRPLRRVTMTAKQVTSLPLGSGEVDLRHRVPETDPRTEVGQLGVAFNQMLGHVETALEERETSEVRLRRFVADASHELRTPLAGIRSYAELARRSTEDVPDEVSHALGRVESEAVRMGRLVDDLLLLARLDTGRPLEQEEVDLSRLVIEVTSDARVAGPDHRWSLDLPDEPLVVRGDEHRLHQVVANLLSNARIHTPAGTSVVVRLSADPAGQTGRQAGRRVILSVRDDGPGIPAELQAHVFERFVRADDSRSRVKGSTGLGLAIAQAVVKAHGGSLTLISRGAGTEFRISLPAGNGV